MPGASRRSSWAHRWLVAALMVGGVVSVGGAGRDARAEEPRKPVSLVDWLQARGQDPSLEARRALFARRFPGERYDGTAEQNLRLLDRLVAEAEGAGGGPGAPAGGGVPMRSIEEQGWRVRLDLSPQVLGLELQEDVRREYARSGRGADSERVEEPPVLPRLPADAVKGFVPAAVLAQKAKQFDDGLYAAVELGAQAGPGGKAELLRRLGEALAAAGVDGDGAEVVFAAARLGGVPASPPPALEAAVDARTRAFDGDERRSKPLGFYTWRDDLRSVFRQDRMLQSPMGPAGAVPLAVALRADASLWEAYGRTLTLYEGLTNPYPDPDLRGPVVVPEPGGPPRPVRFLPPSRSFETDLVKKHWGNRPVPEGASAFQLLIDEVRAGRASLAPTERSGWYDRVAWSLDPLIRPESVPEAPKLRLGPRYRAYLEELFKGLLALARETHVKQLEIPLAGAAAPPPEVVIRVAPGLTVEPLPTHYARRAEGYAFVRGVLERHFGREGLAALRRLTAEGPVAAPLDVELEAMETLFRGAAETARREIGSPDASSTPEADVARAAFAAFATAVGSDPDLARDARMMVPVFYDIERQKTKVWVFLGWTAQWLEVSYARVPDVLSKDWLAGQTSETARVEFGRQSVQVLSPVVAEVYVGRLLDRDQFRRHCDRWVTRGEILKHLE